MFWDYSFIYCSRMNTSTHGDYNAFLDHGVSFEPQLYNIDMVLNFLTFSCDFRLYITELNGSNLQCCFTFITVHSSKFCGGIWLRSLIFDRLPQNPLLRILICLQSQAA